jgi:hypothetical protein
VIPVCDVPSIEYYGIFVIPESRLYEFNRNYNLGNNIPTSKYLSELNGVNTPSNGVIPLMDRAFSVMNQLHLASQMTDIFLQNEFKRNTHGMSFIDKGKFISMQDLEFSSAASRSKIPLFTSKEKALEFLIDVPRILFSSDSYIEFRHGNPISRVAEELSIVKFTLDKVIELSATETLVINPYVPGFF